jgi:hypothetical protein
MLEWVLILNIMVAGNDGVSGAQRWFSTEQECEAARAMRQQELHSADGKLLLFAGCFHPPEGFRAPDKTKQPPANNKSQAI